MPSGGKPHPTRCLNNDLVNSQVRTYWLFHDVEIHGYAFLRSFVFYKRHLFVDTDFYLSKETNKWKMMSYMIPRGSEVLPSNYRDMMMESRLPKLVLIHCTQLSETRTTINETHQRRQKPFRIYSKARARFYLQLAGNRKIRIEQLFKLSLEICHVLADFIYKIKRMSPSQINIITGQFYSNATWFDHCDILTLSQPSLTSLLCWPTCHCGTNAVNVKMLLSAKANEKSITYWMKLKVWQELDVSRVPTVSDFSFDNWQIAITIAAT
jgi:hypothetical protein